MIFFVGVIHQVKVVSETFFLQGCGQEHLVTLKPP